MLHRLRRKDALNDRYAVQRRPRGHRCRSGHSHIGARRQPRVYKLLHMIGRIEDRRRHGK